MKHLKKTMNINIQKTTNIFLVLDVCGPEGSECYLQPHITELPCYIQ